MQNNGTTSMIVGLATGLAAGMALGLALAPRREGRPEKWSDRLLSQVWSESGAEVIKKGTSSQD